MRTPGILTRPGLLGATVGRGLATDKGAGTAEVCGNSELVCGRIAGASSTTPVEVETSRRRERGGASPAERGGPAGRPRPEPLVLEFLDLKDPGSATSGQPEDERPIRDLGTAVGAVNRLRGVGVGVEGSSGKTGVLHVAGDSDKNPAGIGGTGGAASSVGTLSPMNWDALRLSS